MVEVAFVVDPGGWLGDRAGDAARTVAGPLLQSVVSTVWRAVAEGCADVGREVVSALSAPAGIDLSSGWWTGPRTRDLMAVVLGIAASLTVVFLLLALLHGLLAGDPLGMVRNAVAQVPLSVLGMVAVVGVTELLLRLTDALSAAVLAGTPADLSGLVGRYGLTATAVTGGLAGLVLMAVFLVAALLVWAELVVRAALVYLLVAFAPLALAARVWPTTRGVFRRLCELGVALIVSKFAVSLALALGVVALVGGGTTTASSGGGLSLAGLLGGATLMALAAFTPFVVLRILPVLESAAVAQGVSRSPARGVQAAAVVSGYSARVTRLAGGHAPGATSRVSPYVASLSAGSSSVGTGSVSSAAASPARLGGEAGRIPGPTASPPDDRPRATPPPHPPRSRGSR